ncbi:MAG: hypothetical protein AAF939_19260 [Planctomycetota bacterium]
MDPRDILVAFVAIGLGLILTYSAVQNQGRCLQFRAAQWVESNRGRSQARAFVGSVGAAMILIGIFLLIPSRLFSKSPKNQSNSDQDKPATRVTIGTDAATEV